ncbi:protein-disulfide reductase DsbD family protein [Algiphilus sp.]|uniref:protein-disulfide reductase DsbD family protein n=1 Tax=Algiphilus sp. TaxID=1872431 RepID=UPI003B52AE68
MRSVYRLILALACLLVVPLAAAEPVRTHHAEADLHAYRSHAVPGESLPLALRLLPEPGWHTYWRNPGDSGLPTTLDWEAPEGIRFSAIRWPRPETYRLANIVNYGYGQETLHIVDMEVPADWPVGTPIQLSATANWLICSDICVPESATLSLTVPTASAAASVDGIWSDAFDAAFEAIPVAADWPSRVEHRDGRVHLQVQLPDAVTDGRFTIFPIEREVVHHSRAQRIVRMGNTLWLEQPEHPFFEQLPPQSQWVIVGNGGTTDGKAWRITAEQGAVPEAPETAVSAASGNYNAPSAENPETTPAAASTAGQQLLLVLAAAFLGGLILNLMPCVFPVLAIKALGVMHAAGETRRHQRAHGLVYTAGVVVSCLAAAGLLLALRATGEALGWGFQLQSPVFVGALAYLFFAFGLSLSGVFTVGTRIMGIGQSLTERQGLGGSFATGVLAVVVASPCTAPFMGSALGYAVTQPPLVALAIFAALGLGLASPFLIIGFVPQLAQRLPRPGPWMEHFKQAMAFPLYLSVVWLLWVLARQAGTEALLLVMIGMVLVAFAAWLWHRQHLVPRLLRIVALLIAVALLAAPNMRSAPDAVATDDSEQTWSPERVSELRAQGQTVFVNFTADWCITCLANERTTLASQAVRAALAREEVHYLKADWTRSDPRITRALAEFGRNGVPLYVVYRPGSAPEVLPQLLTVDRVLKALDASDSET